MKMLSKIVLAVAGVAAVGAICYRAVNVAPSADLPQDVRMMEIISDAGCAECHTADPKLPFYANWPVAKQVITKDIVEGYKIFDIAPAISAIESGEAVDEVSLAKIERDIMDKSMPPAKYYLVHWGSQLTGSKVAIALEWIRDHRAVHYPNALAAAEFANEPVRPVPDKVDFDEHKAALGKILYHSTALSADGTVSCATCHGINTGGVDNLQYSEGIGGQFGGVNAPTVYNAVFNFAQFWDGRAADLAAQAAGPPLNPVEMGSSSFDEIAERLAADRDFARVFTAVYPEGLCEATITDAIAQYEMTLITPDSAFDRYLKGDAGAMTEKEVNGYNLFKQFSCATCHTGVNMGGQSYELMGDNYFTDRALVDKAGLTDGDNGRWAVTGVERDRHRFRTPGLRNVALTNPYYHDGSVNTLEDAVRMMSEYQSRKKISDGQVEDIVAFLNTLTGKYEGNVLVNDNQK